MLEQVFRPQATPYRDDQFQVTGSADATKLFKLEVDTQAAGKTLTLDVGAQTQSRTASIPVLTASDTFAFLGVANVFSAANRFNAGVSINQALTANLGSLQVTDTNNSTSGTTFSTALTSSYAPSSASTAVYNGLVVLPTVTGVNAAGATLVGQNILSTFNPGAAGNIATIVGSNYQPILTCSGNFAVVATTIQACTIQHNINATTSGGSVTATNLTGFDILTNTNLVAGTTGSVTTYKQLRLQAISNTGAVSLTVTNRFAISQEDSLSTNAFAGKITCSLTTDSTGAGTGSVQLSGGMDMPSTKSFFGGGIKSVSPTLGIGYATGSGGVVTQATSKATGVTLNTVTGTITMNNANLAAATSVGFTLTNSTIAATDTPIVVIKSGATADSYTVQVDAVAAGSCRISLRNYTAGALAEAVVLSFNIFKGVAA